MKIILTQDVADLGLRGDVVDVSDGYARNYLVPRSLAVKASAGALKDAEKIRSARQDLAQRELEHAQRLAHSLKGASGSLGAEELQAEAAAVELLIKEQKTDDIESELEQLDLVLQPLLIEVSQWLSNDHDVSELS